MKKNELIRTSLLLVLCASPFFAQEKGVDTQNTSIRDASGGNNSGKQDTGSGRGINFGKGPAPANNTIPNPFKITARRETILQALNDLLREKGITIDIDTSRPNEGIIRTQPFVFAKGSVITISELERYAEATISYNKGWTRARHTLVIETQPIDGTSLNLSITAKIEGRSAGPAGPEWVTLRSNGDIERQFIIEIVEAVTGASPAVPTPK